MDLFFHPELEETTKHLKFEGEEFHHITRVMRYVTGQEFSVTNGKGLIANAKLLEISKSNCVCEVIEIKSFPKRKENLIALVPILKNLERFEFAIEKLTELGVNEIVPYYSERSVKKNFRFERSQKILISAIKQSFNPYLPKLRELTLFDKYFENVNQNDLILYGNPEGKTLIQLMNSIDLSISQNIIITVGPEGDFTEQEIEILKSKNGIAVNLGNNRLRSETAIISLLVQLRMFMI